MLRVGLNGDQAAEQEADEVCLAFGLGLVQDVLDGPPGRRVVDLNAIVTSPHRPSGCPMMKTTSTRPPYPAPGLV